MVFRREMVFGDAEQQYNEKNGAKTNVQSMKARQHKEGVSVNTGLQC